MWDYEKKTKEKRCCARGEKWNIFNIARSFCTGIFFFAWCRVQYVKTGYDISRETAKRQQLLSLQRNFKIELARLKSPERLSKIARNRLGLAAPETGQTIIIP